MSAADRLCTCREELLMHPEELLAVAGCGDPAIFEVMELHRHEFQRRPRGPAWAVCVLIAGHSHIFLTMRIVRINILI